MTNSWLTFDPVFPIWTIGLMLFFPFAFFIWKEIKRPQKFLVARIITQLLVFISILGLLTQPSYREEKSSSPIVLLTPGYEKSKVDSIMNKNASIKIVRTKESEDYPNSEVMSSYNDLGELSKSIGIIIGHGLPAYVLESMRFESYKFIPAALPFGITALNIPKPVVVNKRNFIDGVFHSSGKSTLKLTGPAGVEDSVTFKEAGSFSFHLSFKTKQSGLFVYTLNYQNEASKIVTERVPIEIVDEEKLNILILQKFPTAEVRYLKNYLAEKGHALALRYQTSKTNFKYEYANASTVKIDRVTTDVLQATDLIILDDNVLNELMASEKHALETAIKNGLGMIIMSDDFSKKNKTITELLRLQVKQLTKDTVHLRLGNSKLNALPVVPVEITLNASIQPTLLRRGRVLSGYVFSGAGKTGFQLVKETYRVSLEGHEDSYSFIWSDLIEKTARTKNESFKPRLTNSFPYYPDEPLNLTVVSSEAQPILHNEKNVVPLIEDVIIDDYWQGKSWAGKPGWHHFTTQDSTQLNYFVSTVDEWKSLRVANQIRTNELVQTIASKKNASIESIHKPIPLLVFFLIFLFASGFLWLAPKI